MNTRFGAAIVLVSLFLGACGPDTGDNMPVHEDLAWEAFDRLSYEDKLDQATALLVIRYDIDDQGNVTPVVTHRKSRLGPASPPYQVGDVYLADGQKRLLEYLDGELRHLGEGAVVIFSGDPPQQRGNRFIREGAVSGDAPIPVSEVLAGFDGAPVVNGEPAEMLTLEPDLSKGETGQAEVTVSAEEKAILVAILERRGLRFEVAPQNEMFVVGWVGMDADMEQVIDEFDAACE